MDLLTLMTAFDVTVVVSVTKAETKALKLDVAVTIKVSTWPLVAVVGTLPTATKRNTPPGANTPELVTGVVLSATPSPLPSA